MLLGPDVVEAILEDHLRPLMVSVGATKGDGGHEDAFILDIDVAFPIWRLRKPVGPSR
jgi:hypothetical protein